VFNKRLISVIALVASASVAQAELKICNSSNDDVNVSVGYDVGNLSVSEGWFPVLAGGCRIVVQGDLMERYYYVHAAGPNGASPGTGDFFCTLPPPNRYNPIVGSLNCASRGFQSRNFHKIDTGTDNGFTHTFY
jgi:uncharacterized membrane protein